MTLHKMMIWLGCMAFCAAAFPLGAIAQQATPPADTLYQLDPVVITAGLSPAQSSKTGRNVLVIKGSEIARLPVNSVDELLRYLPGLEVQARGPMGVQSDISIRGTTFQQVLVILDGIRLNDPLTGHFSSYIPLPAQEIERIEILKGAASAIYGTEAVGGVIHIITKTFAQTNKGSNAAVQATAGQYGLWGVNAGGHWANEKTTLSAGILSNHATGQQQRGTRGFFDLTSVSLGARHKLGEKWAVNWRSAYDHRDFSAQNFYTTFTSDTAAERVATWWHQASVQYQGKKLRWVTDAGYKKLDDHYAFNPRAVPNQNNSTLWQLLTRATLPLSNKITLTSGIQLFERTIASNDRGNHQVWQRAIFAMAQYTPLPGLQIDPALRLDVNQRSGAEWVPQLNVSYRLAKVQLRGSAGRTLREADFTERFNNYNRPRVTSGRIGNPDLQTESAWNYEAGADFIGKKWRVSTTFFARNQRRLIDWVNTPYAQMPRQVNLVPTGTYALARNIWQVNTVGWEADVSYTLPVGRSGRLQGQAGLMLLSNSGNEGTPSLYLSAQANLLLNLHVLYETGRWQLSATGLHKQREPQPRIAAIEAALSSGYTLVNAKVQYRVVQKFSLFVQADNVGNVNYTDILGSRMPRRWLMTGLVWNWN